MRDKRSQITFSFPAMGVDTLTSKSNAMHSNVNTIDALVTIVHRHRSVLAHVRAVMLYPLSSMSMSMSDTPSLTSLMSANIAPMYSLIFWNEENFLEKPFLGNFE